MRPIQYIAAGRRRRRVVPARTRAIAAIVVGLAVGIPIAVVTEWRYGLLAGWDIASMAFLIWIWTAVWPLDGTTTQQLSELEDPTRPAADVILLTAAIVSLVTVALVLARAGQSSGAGQVELGAFGVGSIALSWGVVHTVFTLRYARMYYRGPNGGVDFNQDSQPTYRDFAYMAFTIGMTFQVADTAVEDPEIRSEVLRHALLSFMFGTGILAASINLVASLVSA